MHYKVKRYKGGKLAETEVWKNYSLNAIREQARQWVERGEADRIHVRDSSGKLVVRYPRWLCPPDGTSI